MTAKNSIISWWIFILFTLFLWYRNKKYDRAFAIFVFLLGLVQLIEYGIYSGTNPNQSAKAIYITLWLQCLVLSISVFIFIKTSSDDTVNHTYTLQQNIVTTISAWTVFLFSIVFIFSLIYLFISDSTISSRISNDNKILYFYNDNPILNNWLWLYCLGILIPLFLLFFYSMCSDITIALIIIYSILSGCIIYLYYSPYCFNTMWCSFSIGLVFILWFLGLVDI